MYTNSMVYTLLCDNFPSLQLPPIYHSPSLSPNTLVNFCYCIQNYVTSQCLSLALGPYKRNFILVLIPLQDYISPSPGPIVDIDTGKVVGSHQGLFLFTLGQRVGLSGIQLQFNKIFETPFNTLEI